MTSPSLVVAALHPDANRRTAAHSQVYKHFKEGKHRILVATDLVGRGIDIERVNIVINYDMPESDDKSKGESKHGNGADTYLHRVSGDTMALPDLWAAVHPWTLLGRLIVPSTTILTRAMPRVLSAGRPRGPLRHQGSGDHVRVVAGGQRGAQRRAGPLRRGHQAPAGEDRRQHLHEHQLIQISKGMLEQGARRRWRRGVLRRGEQLHCMEAL